jgi:hypothetical protein
MNIKNIRRNYNTLTMKERLILLDMAETRDDEIEMKAIVQASPKESWKVCDFVESHIGLRLLRLINLIQRLHRQRDFMFYLRFADKDNDDDHFFACASMEAYFYMVDAEVDKAIFAELGFNQEIWTEREKALFDNGIEGERIDDLMRQMAFDESEAQEFMNEFAEKKGLPGEMLNYTFEKRLEKIREILANGDLSELFKS